ncbi:MAG: hypothetical protein H8Z69_05600 [Nanohaloarchaea archaeon]|nr:hypothetical protein [Candidatus Nanohaloarchaea archaeon]
MEDIEDIVDDEETARKLEEIIEMKVEDKLNSTRDDTTREDISESGFSRRQFLKKLSYGVLGISALSVPVSGFDVKSSDGLEVFTNAKKHFDVNPGGPVSIKSANLNMNQGEINSASNISFANNEKGDYDEDGLLYWDKSAGLYIKSSNSSGSETGGRLQWSGANVTAGNQINVSYSGEDHPTISVNDGAGSGLDADKIKNNHIYVQSSQPSSPTTNDIWVDTS